jgi:Rieske Fe-S protein
MCVALASAGIVATALQGCTSIPLIKATPENGKISVDENAFGKSSYVLVRPKNFSNDILLVRYSPVSIEYYGLLMQCTHQQQPLNVNGNIIHCPAHGSEFDLNGNVTKEPALKPLKKYTAVLNQGKITIDLNS